MMLQQCQVKQDPCQTRNELVTKWKRQLMTSFMRNLESVPETPGDISNHSNCAMMCLESGIEYSNKYW